MLSSNKKVKEISLRNYDQPEEIKPTIDDILKITLSSLKKTTTLVKLDLNWSSFHDEGFDYLTNFIRKNNTLKELYIGDCVNIELENLNNFIQDNKSNPNFKTN
jgi:Ran GTPase-activating protein (RanGAP) involved in mRNA processing and transport